MIAVIIEHLKDILSLSETVKAGSRFIKVLLTFIMFFIIFLIILIIGLLIVFTREILFYLDEIGKIKTIEYVKNGTQLVVYSFLLFIFYYKVKEFFLDPEFITLEAKEIFYKVYKEKLGLGYGISFKNFESMQLIKKETNLRPNTIKQIIIEDFELMEDGLYYPIFENVPISILNREKEND